MTLTPEDLAVLSEAMRTAAAGVAEEVARRIVHEVLSGPEIGADVTPADTRTPGEIAAAETETQRAAAAEAEAQRWASMSADELAAAESAARIQRWRDAHADLTGRGVPLDPLADLEADMTPGELAAAKKG